MPHPLRCLRAKLLYVCQLALKRVFCGNRGVQFANIYFVGAFRKVLDSGIRGSRQGHGELLVHSIKKCVAR